MYTDWYNLLSLQYQQFGLQIAFDPLNQRQKLTLENITLCLHVLVISINKCTQFDASMKQLQKCIATSSVGKNNVLNTIHE